MVNENNLSGKIGFDTSDFKSGIATLNRELRIAESGFQSAAAKLGDYAKTASGLELRIAALSEKMGLQQQKVTALALEHARLVAEHGKGSIAAQNMEVRLNNETAALGKMELELGNTEKALNEMGDESDDTAKEEDDAAKSTDKFADALKGLKSKLNDSVTGLKNMVVGVGKLAAGLAIGFAAAVAGAVVGLGGLILKSAQLADNIVESAEKMGISATQYQEFAYVAGQIGTDVESIGGAFSRTTKAIKDANTAGSPMADIFRDLGVSVKDANGNLRDTPDVFGDLITSIGAIENETDREILAQQLFGKSYQDLIPLINLGADGLAAMTKEASDMGAVMSEEAVTGLAGLSDMVGGVKAGFQGLVGELANKFLPMGEAFVGWIRETLIPWIQDFLPKAIQVLSDYWTNTLQPAIEKVWNWISTVLIPFIKDIVVPWLQENLPKAIQTLSDFWTTVLQPAIEDVWNWMSTVLIPFLQDVVFPWLQENIPKALQTLSDFWTDVLQPAIENVWAWIKDTLIPFFQNTLMPVVGEDIPNAIQTLSDFWTLTLKPAIETVWDFISTYILPIFQDVIDIMGEISGIVGTAFAGFWDKVLQPAIKTVYDFFNDHILPILKDVMEFIRDEIGPKVQWLADEVFTPLANVLSGALKDALTWFRDTLLKIKDFLKNFTLPDWLTPGSPTPFEMGLRGINEAMREMSTYNLPALQNSLNGFGGRGGFGGSVYSPTWQYNIQAANPLQTSDDLVRQVRLLELMH